MHILRVTWFIASQTDNPIISESRPKSQGLQD